MNLNTPTKPVNLYEQVEEQFKICDMIANKCQQVIASKNDEIYLLEEKIKIMEKNKPKSNWLLWLLGGIATGLVISNVSQN